MASGANCQDGIHGVREAVSLRRGSRQREGRRQQRHQRGRQCPPEPAFRHQSEPERHESSIYIVQFGPGSGCLESGAARAGHLCRPRWRSPRLDFISATRFRPRSYMNRGSTVRLGSTQAVGGTVTVVSACVSKSVVRRSKISGPDSTKVVLLRRVGRRVGCKVVQLRGEFPAPGHSTHRRTRLPLGRTSTGPRESRSCHRHYGRSETD